eukprot:GILK01009982.1.p1 GENE.GILK01009982.1~~GILK01009982.1.p1  ORF type:complete len:898 (+),score=183.75 GILK01009982.1:127-2820(+)
MDKHKPTKGMGRVENVQEKIATAQQQLAELTAQLSVLEKENGILVADLLQLQTNTRNAEHSHFLQLCQFLVQQNDAVRTKSSSAGNRRRAQSFASFASPKLAQKEVRRSSFGLLDPDLPSRKAGTMKDWQQMLLQIDTPGQSEKAAEILDVLQLCGEFDDGQADPYQVHKLNRQTHKIEEADEEIFSQPPSPVAPVPSSVSTARTGPRKSGPHNDPPRNLKESSPVLGQFSDPLSSFVQEYLQSEARAKSVHMSVHSSSSSTSSPTGNRVANINRPINHVNNYVNSPLSSAGWDTPTSINSELSSGSLSSPFNRVSIPLSDLPSSRTSDQHVDSADESTPNPNQNPSIQVRPATNSIDSLWQAGGSRASTVTVLPTGKTVRSPAANHFVGSAVPDTRPSFLRSNSDKADFLPHFNTQVTADLADSKTLKSSSSLHFETQLDSESSYIYDEPDTLSNIVLSTQASDQVFVGKREQTIKCATHSKLVERLTHEKYQDLSNRFAFLLTYRSFMTPVQLLEALIHRYFVPAPPNMTLSETKAFNRGKRAQIQIKVFGVLKSWIEERFDDFESNQELRERLELFFIDALRYKYGPWVEKSIASIRSLVLRMEGPMKKKSVLDVTNRQSPLPPVLPRRELTMKQLENGDGLLDLDALEIARQLTLIDFNMFTLIEPQEFMNQAWVKSEKNELAPHIVAMTDRFNVLSSWVAACIVRETEQSRRGSYMKQFLKIASKCRLLNNFTSLFGIFAGLSSSPIYRLRKTWESLPSKYLEVYTSLQQLFLVDDNHKNIRMELMNAVTPCVPHMPVFLKDLFMIDDTLPNELRGMVNFYKHRKISDLIDKIRTYQKVSYPFQRVPVLAEYLQSIRMVSEEELFQMSKLREPTVTQNIKGLTRGNSNLNRS